MKLQVITWFWRQPEGRTLFRSEHVNIWAAMVRQHCTLPIDIACVTDVPEGIDPSIRIITPPGFHDGLTTSRWRGGRPSCYRRLAMFAPDAARIFGQRFVSMDLDVVIGSSIDAILDRREDFVICGPSQQGERYIYNGSMMLMDAGARPCVYEDFTPEGAELASRRFVGSDQAWIAHSLGRGEATWGPDDGVVRWDQAQEGAMMFFPGNIKPWNCIAHPFVGKHYRLGAGIRAMIITDHLSAIDQATAQQGEFDRVIALPRAARRYRGRIDHIAENMRHAELLAGMVGCDDPVICRGR